MAADNATSTFTLEIKDDVSGATETAATSLETLARQLNEDTTALGAMQKALRNLKSASGDSGSAVQQLKDQIEIQKAVIGDSQVKLIELGGVYGAVEATTRRFGAAASAAGGAAAKGAEQAKLSQTQLATETNKAAAALAREQAFAALSSASLADLAQVIKQDTAAATQLEGALKRMQSVAGGNVAEIDRMKAALTQHKAAVAVAQERYVKLGGDLSKLGGSAREANTWFRLGRVDLDKFGAAAGVLPGPLGSIAQRMGPLKGLIESGAAGTLGLAAALVAVAVGAIAGAIALLKFGFGASSAKRESDLALAAFIAMDRSTKGAAMGVDALSSSIDYASARTAASREQMTGYARNLYTLGLRGASLDEALRGVGIAAGAAGDAGAKAFLKQAAATNRSEAAIRGLTAATDAQLGAIANSKLKSFSVQITKLKENFTALFSGLKLDKFLDAFSMVTGMFRETSAVGAAIKQMFEGLFQPLINGASKGLVVKRFIQGLTIGALHLYIAYLKVRIALRDAFDGTALGNLDSATVALRVGQGVAIALAVALGAVAVAALGVAVAMAAVMIPIVAIGAGILWVVDQFNWLVDNWNSIDFGAMGQALIDGLVNGIKAGADAVGKAVSNLAESAKESFKETLGIQSPSRVFRGYGVALGQGVVVGSDEMRPRVRRSMAELVQPPPVEPVRVPKPIMPDAANLTIASSVTAQASLSTDPTRPEPSPVQPSRRREPPPLTRTLALDPLRTAPPPQRAPFRRRRDPAPLEQARPLEPGPRVGAVSRAGFGLRFGGALSAALGAPAVRRDRVERESGDATLPGLTLRPTTHPEPVPRAVPKLSFTRDESKDDRDDAPPRPFVPPPPPAAGAAGASVTFNANITVQSSATNPAELVQDLEAPLTNLLERVAVQLGAKL